MSSFAFRLRGKCALAWAALICSGALVLSCAATAPVAGAHPVPTSTKTTRCSIAKVWHSLGPTYVESLFVGGVNCATGETIVKAYNACRIKAGGVKGYCRSRVDGYTFSELPRTTSPVQFIAKVTAKKGRDVIVFTYSEDT